MLAINGTQVPVSAGASSVALAFGLSTGSAYAVSVGTQPSGQSCSVANGSGTITSANVANVVVTCANQAYALGGTISGLNGSGLVLANGSDMLTLTSGATSFTLPTRVAFGSSYNVTVATQPPGLACAVSQGMGTMGANALTGVVVSCTDQPFSLGGMISGLNGSGLVLANATDMLTLTSGATSFTLPTPVAFGSSYNVTVATQPTGLACAVSQGMGTMGAGNVTTVMVACSDQSYSLGGSISGLSASGLVLANGSDTRSVPSAATGFTLPTPVPFGSSYNVTVASQPSGLTCSLSNASSTMPAAAVTNVMVSCSVSTYTVGGTISGLSASGLVLLDNGVDTTPIAANATQFTMHTGIAYGSGYAITVHTQPAGETCQITQGSGTNINANVSSVAISCAPWSTFTTSVLYSFGGSSASPPDGAGPEDSLIQGADGNLYGNTGLGGTNNTGTVFKLTLAGVETVLYSFGSSASGDAINPYASLILGSDSNLYCTSGAGGASSDGTMFEVTPAGAETVMYSFTGGSSDGSRPNGPIQGSDTNFYGTTPSGGTHGVGTVYQVTPAGTETVLYSFGSIANDGSEPLARLVQASDGNFYGTTSAGGANGAGTVFKITPAGVETVLYSFGGASDGTAPEASLIQGSDGNLYSTTTNGGSYNLGTVFQITTAGVESVLYSFGTNALDGTNPFARLFQGSDGNLWGTTPVGGANGLGVVFKLTLAGAETIVYPFAGGSDGAYPQSSLIQAGDGNFYSTTMGGGASNLGTVFKIVPQ